MILDASGKPLSGEPETQPRMVEIVRSFSFKLNLGNYQSADFFASQKAQCEPGMVDEVSTDLYDWCYDQVMASVKDVQDKQARKQAAIARKGAA